MLRQCAEFIDRVILKRLHQRKSDEDEMSGEDEMSDEDVMSDEDEIGD